MKKDDINPWSSYLEKIKNNPALVDQVNHFYQLVEDHGQEKAHQWLDTLPDETGQTVLITALANQVEMLTALHGLTQPNKLIIGLSVLQLGGLEMDFDE